MAVNILDELRKLLQSAEAEEPEGPDEADPEEQDEEIPDEAAEDSEDSEEAVESEESEETDDEPEEGTPGAAEDGDAEDDDLRATIREQAAAIETLRNRLAEAGLDDAIETAEVVESDAEDEDVVEAFDSDYAERKAMLAELTKGD